MDEPTSALTESEVERLFRIIERLLARGVTIVYISHKLDEVFRRSDRITVLRDGRHVKTIARVGNEPARDHASDGRARDQQLSSCRRTARAGEVVLEVAVALAPLDRTRPRLAAAKTSAFALRRGEVLGVAGLMGAGRTELLECLFGTSPEPPVGRIVLEGARGPFRVAGRRQAGGRGARHGGPQAAGPLSAD